LRVKLPEELSDKEKELFEQLRTVQEAKGAEVPA
jgi:hypothetical protein